MTDIVYAIRTKEEARTTLEALTGIPFTVWEREEETASRSDQHIKEVMRCYGGRLNRITEFVFTHLTSSANECLSIRRYGLTDLCRSYEHLRGTVLSPAWTSKTCRLLPNVRRL